MQDNFLQELLKAKLFDIGEADDRLTWLKSAITDLQKKFEEDYSLLPTYTLVALDPNISDSEPILIETEKIITAHWEALRVRFADMPRNIIRGVILSALNTLGNSDALAARIIWLTALNFYPFAKLNAEKDLVEKMLNRLGEMAEETAVEEWSLLEEEPSLKLGTLKVSGLEYTPVNVNAEDFKNKLTTAATPGFSQHQNQQGFGQHFGQNASSAIIELFNQLNTGLSKGLSTATIETSLNKFFTDFKKSLDANLKASFSSLTAVERRSKLLWWKETLYSPSQKRSYRGLDKHLLPILMSIDLNNQVPEITPISVDYLLRDTLFLLNEKKDESTKFSTLLSEVSNENIKSILKPLFETISEDEGRLSITNYLSLLVNDRIGTAEFKTRTGIDEKEQLTFGDLSVIVLHDLLVQRLISE
jgi:hypothetical protein